jgi:hypothetical protein
MKGETDMTTRDFTAELEAAREAGNWDAHARIWEERRLAEVESDEAQLTTGVTDMSRDFYSIRTTNTGPAQRPSKSRVTDMRGWEKTFWGLLSPETARLTRDEIAMEAERKALRKALEVFDRALERKLRGQR